MFISIVIPYYKDKVRLLELLFLLEHQELKKEYWEVLVVNNDPLISLRFPEGFNVSYSLKILEEPTPGSYAARNLGVKFAKGNIIGFTDSDMLPDSKWIQVAFNQFEKDVNGEIGILTGPVPLFYRNPEKLSPAETYEKYTGFDFEGYAKEGASGAGNWFSYKAVINEFGGFRKDLKSNGDTDLSLRISSKYSVFYLPELINRHPARYFTRDLVFRYRRIIGGAYTRRFKGNKLRFLNYILNFVFRRYRFSLKKFVTLPFHESIAIFRVCNALNLGAIKEYFSLISGGQTKR